MPLVAQSCDYNEDKNTTTGNGNDDGNDDSGDRALTPRLATERRNSIHPHLPTHPPWQQTARKLLRRLSKGFVLRDEDLRGLNAIISELANPPAGVLSVAETRPIIALFETEDYKLGRRALNSMGRGRIPDAKCCSNYISWLLVDWTKHLAKEAGNQVEVVR